MKIAINTCFGGFEINDFIAKQYGIDKYEVSRTDPKLIELIESSKKSGKAIDAGRHSCVKVCTIPDEATDWEILDYDGLEDVIYVLNGKLHRAH